MKRLPLVVTLASLLGCSGNVETSGATGGNGGTGGGSTSSSTSTAGTAGQGGTTGQGGSGGGIFTGGTAGAGGTTTSPASCAIVLDKGFFVSFTVDGQPFKFTSNCGSDDPMGPMAYMFHGKGSGADFDIAACDTAASYNPQLDLFADDPAVPDTVTSLSYTDAAGNTSSTSTGVSTFTTFGPEWTEASGTFHGKLTAANGAIQTLDGSFLVCRRPDLYAP